MRQPILLLLSFLLSLSPDARGKSRLVLYRAVDDGKGLAYVMCDGKIIAALKRGGVVVFDAEDTKGVYYLCTELVPRSAGYKKVAICPEPNSVTILGFSGKFDKEYVSYAFVLDYNEFAETYSSGMRLKRALGAQGFESMEQLSNGFSRSDARQVTRQIPKKTLIPGQVDTIYFDKGERRTFRENAKTYGITRCEAEDRYEIEKYNVDDNTRDSRGSYADIDSFSRHGKFTFYYTSGRIMSSGVFVNDKHNGDWTCYYDNNAGTLWYTLSYWGDGKKKERVSYYLSGKLKRREQYAHILDIDTVISGKRYDEAGNEITFTPFELPARAPFSINGYLSSSLTYPKHARLNDVEGKVIVTFVVSEEGNIGEAHVTRHVSPELDELALHVVETMPAWIPGKLDDELVKIYFNQPIVYKLE